MQRSVVICLHCFLTLTLQAADWPGWRGADGLGVSVEANLPLRWSENENVAWKIEIPGWGNSSPVIAGDRIYLTTTTDDNAFSVVAIDPSRRKVVWKRKIGTERLKTHNFHNMATPTPVADRNHVWALFGTGDLACLSKDGEILWRRQMREDHGQYRIMWGMGSSLLGLGDKIYLVCLHTGPSYLLAINKKSGKDVWKTKRDLPARGEGRDAYTSPILARWRDSRFCGHAGCQSERGEAQPHVEPFALVIMPARCDASEGGCPRGLKPRGEDTVTGLSLLPPGPASVDFF